MEFNFLCIFLGHGECCLEMPTGLKQADFNRLESSSFQCHDYTGLCTNI